MLTCLFFFKPIFMSFATGAVNVLLTTPMWVVNTRLKLQGAKFRNENIHQTHYRGIFGQNFLLKFIVTQSACGHMTDV